MPKQKLSGGPDSNQAFPTLLELCSHQFAKGLWQRIIKQNVLPSTSSKFDQTFIEHCKNLVLQDLQKNTTSIVKRCQTTIVARVDQLMSEMVTEFSPLILSRLISYVLDTSKWNEFVLSMWFCLKQRISEQRIIFLFESITKKIDTVGLEAIPKDELEMYLQIWKDLPKRLKLSVFNSVAYYYPRRNDSNSLSLHTDAKAQEKVKNLRRDLRFVSMLLAEFDLSERQQLWRENWLYLVFGASPSSLESLMKMCCDSDEQIEHFKESWLSKHEIIDNYYSLLMRWKFFDELNLFLSFYSTDETKVLDLSAKILRLHFCSVSFTSDSSIDVVKIAQCGGWLEKTIKLPEFEYYLRKDDVKIKLNWSWYLEEGKFDEMLEYVTFFVPDASERIKRERQYLREFFFQIDLPLCVSYRRIVFKFRFLSHLEEFDKHIGRIFDSVDDAVEFKKKMIFSQFTMDGLRHFLDEKFSHTDDIQGLKFVTMCLQDEQDLAEWKEVFMRDTLRCIRLSCHLKGLFREANNFMTWCLGSPEKVLQFKTELSIDDLFVAMERFIVNAGDAAEARRGANLANQILKWWCDDPASMAALKLQKLKKCQTNGLMYAFLLGDFKDAYATCQNDEERAHFALVSCTYHHRRF